MAKVYRQIQYQADIINLEQMKGQMHVIKKKKTTPKNLTKNKTTPPKKTTKVLTLNTNSR